jgi:hypothetical protein
VRARGRGALLAGVVAASAGAAWLTWPRPDVALEVDRGGLGYLVGRAGRAALPETIRVAARGRPTVRIVNRDTAAAQLGIFTAPPGRVVEYTLPGPGSYGGYCSAHATKRALTFVVGG